MKPSKSEQTPIYLVVFDYRLQGMPLDIQEYYAIQYEIEQFGKTLGHFTKLRNFTYSFNHDLFDYEPFTPLVNSLNGLEKLQTVNIIVQKSNNFRYPNQILHKNWTERLKKSVKVKISAE